MTVAELIERLKRFDLDPEIDVRFQFGCEGCDLVSLVEPRFSPIEFDNGARALYLFFGAKPEVVLAGEPISDPN